MLEWLNYRLRFILEKSSPYLEQHMSWYYIIPIYFVVYLILFETLKVFISKELRKRKQIVIDVSLYKEFQTLKDEMNKKDNEQAEQEVPDAENDVTKMALQYKQKRYPDAYYRNIKKLIQDKKPLPFLLIIAVTAQSMLTYAVISYLLKQNNLEYQLIFASIASLLSVLLLLGKNKLWLRIPLCIATSCFYFFIGTSEALIFISLFSTYSLIKRKAKR